MDKVIIDKVDVSGCEFYIADDKYSCDLSFINKEELCNCDNINDCYYKQLKRLEQENEKLKSNIYPQTNYTTQQFYTKEEYEKLEQENERLKDELRVAQMNRMTMFETLDIVTEKDTYKQALQEIREYIGTCCHRFSENHKNLCFGCEYDKEVCDYSIILTKINEVIGAK